MIQDDAIDDAKKTEFMETMHCAARQASACTTELLGRLAEMLGLNLAREDVPLERKGDVCRTVLVMVSPAVAYAVLMHAALQPHSDDEQQSSAFAAIAEGFAAQLFGSAVEGDGEPNSEGRVALDGKQTALALAKALHAELGERLAQHATPTN